MTNETNKTDKTLGDHPGTFLAFFYHLRSSGLKVTPTQWLDLIKGLSLGLHGSSLIGFYYLARSVLVKDETELDDFDMIFAEHFHGVEGSMTSIENDIWSWLENPIAPHAVDPELKKMMDQVDVEALREEFERRLAEQTERHDGGGRWIGTGGTSKFGHSGYHPGGMRVAGERGHGSAVQVAAQRNFREHRNDLVLDTRQFGVALKKLRSLKRDGLRDELNVDATIDKTARSGDELQLIFEAPRANSLNLILAMDVGGSMEPYRQLVDLLFSAAHGAQHFKRFEHVYFHNCIYENVYADTNFSDPIPLHDLFRRFNRETRLILVGDAYMYQGELTQKWGAINWSDHNEKPGLYHLGQLTEHFKHCAWLNPEHESGWGAPSTRLIRRLFQMYPLTVEGVDSLAKNLSSRI